MGVVNDGVDGSLQLWRKKSGVWLQCLHSAFGLGAVASPLVLGWSGLQPSFLAIAGVSNVQCQPGHTRPQEDSCVCVCVV